MQDTTQSTNITGNKRLEFPTRKSMSVRRAITPTREFDFHNDKIHKSQMEKIPMLFYENTTPTGTARSQSAWDDLMSKTQDI